MAVELPRTALYEHIRRNIDPSGRLPADLGLPDDAKLTPDAAHWVAGALDGLFVHGDEDADADRAAEVVDLLAEACRKPLARQLYDADRGRRRGVLPTLRSPLIGNRYRALTAFSAWPPDRWPHGEYDLVRETARSDPDESTREYAELVATKHDNDRY